MCGRGVGPGNFLRNVTFVCKLILKEFDTWLYKNFRKKSFDYIAMCVMDGFSLFLFPALDQNLS